jgi:hypothetical protein
MFEFITASQNPHIFDQLGLTDKELFYNSDCLAFFQRTNKDPLGNQKPEFHQRPDQ